MAFDLRPKNGGKQKGYRHKLVSIVNELLKNDDEFTKRVSALDDKIKMRAVWRE